MFSLGIDIGSFFVKVVVYDYEKGIIFGIG